jgi:hypothetical protein
MGPERNSPWQACHLTETDGFLEGGLGYLAPGWSKYIEQDYTLPVRKVKRAKYN